MRRIACGLLLVWGCSSDTGGDVTGPFSGDVHRYKVDKLTLPSTTALQNEFADDLDGDGSSDNQLGLIVAALTQTGDTNKHIPDMIASGALSSVVELQVDGLDHDDTAGLRYLGKPTSSGMAIGGVLTAGAFASNRTRTTKHFETADVTLPVFADADPLVVPFHGLEVDLTSDGAGGFDGIIRGGIPLDDARTIAYAGVLQMMRTNPAGHLVFARTLDTNHDGAISQPELAASELLAGFIHDDIVIDGDAVLSAALSVHLCAEGQCSIPAPANPCTDRIKDGAETDIDCGGGTCPVCASELACVAPTDCQSGACDASKCRAATCSDALRDGFESDVDCGAACAMCVTGQHCANGADCASGRCDAAPASSGTCAP